MSYEELMRRHKIKTNVNNLDDEERERYEAFLALGETPTDKRALGNAWLRHHAAEAIAWAK